MATKVVMPRLSLTMVEGTVGKWYKKAGETVEKEEPIVEVVSEKATYDLEAPASGVLRRIYVEAGVTAPVGEALAIITDAGEEIPENATNVETAKPAKGDKEMLASPAAKRLARENNIDLSDVRGSGPEGRIIEQDVQRFVEEKLRALPKIKETIQLDSLRKISAERVSSSFRTAPHSTLVIEIDASKIRDLHNRLMVSYTAILAGAVALSLKEHPIMNSTLSDGQIRVFEDVNVGLATATEKGLVVPIIRNTDKKTLQEIDGMLKQLADKAKSGKLSKEDLTGGTFTITNLGMYGVEFFTPIINPPEAAILGVGMMSEKPVVIDGGLAVRPTMKLSLSFDHRIIDGAPAANFLRTLKKRVEEALEFEC